MVWKRSVCRMVAIGTAVGFLVLAVLMTFDLILHYFFASADSVSLLRIDHAGTV